VDYLYCAIPGNGGKYTARSLMTVTGIVIVLWCDSDYIMTFFTVAETSVSIMVAQFCNLDA
jgi:hypothetical protein